jgi:hypothetical protein
MRVAKEKRASSMVIGTPTLVARRSPELVLPASPDFNGGDRALSGSELLRLLPVVRATAPETAFWQCSSGGRVGRGGRGGPDDAHSGGARET